MLGDIQSHLAAIGIVADNLGPSPHYREGIAKATMDERISRGERIRLALSVSESSSPRIRTGGSEDAQGGLLHSGPLMEEHCRARPGRTLVTFDIGSGATGTDVERSRAMRWFDEDSFELWVNGRSNDLRVLFADLRQVSSCIRLQGRAGFTKSFAPRRQGPIPIGVAMTIVSNPSDSAPKPKE